MQVGGAIGLAVLATLASGRTDKLLAGGASHDAALNSGYHLAYLVGTGLVAVAIVVALAVLRSEAPAGAVAEGEADVHAGRREPAFSESG